MTSIKEWSVLLIKALEEQDITKFKHCRVAIVSALADNDYMINSTENLFEMSSASDNLIVGKALSILLYDMSKSGLIYRRVVVSAMYCLIKSIINDRSGYNKETTIASVFLLILFHENEDFIGGEYIIQMVRNNPEVAAHQFIGMTCVFYWLYKLSSFSIELDGITNSRLQKAVNNSLLQMTDESTRTKVIDFEYNNFDAMLKSLPLDFELKYPGVPFWDPEVINQKIEAMFGNSPLCFRSQDNTAASYSGVKTKAQPHPLPNKNTMQHNDTTSKGAGCLSVIVFVVIVSIFSII